MHQKSYFLSSSISEDSIDINLTWVVLFVFAVANSVMTSDHS